MIKNQVFTGTCIDYSYDGLGVVKHDTFCIFVKDMIKGETGEIIVTALRKDYGYGRLLKLLEPSEERAEPLCPISRQCGGCQFQHMSYQEQLSFKQQHVTATLRNIGGIDSEVSEIMPSPQQYYYRNKAQLPVARDKQGKLQIGYYRHNSHEIIPMEKCYMHSELVSNMTNDIRDLLEKYGVGDLMRHLVIRQLNSGEIMVVFVVRKHCDLNELVRELISLYPSIYSVIENINDRDTNVILGSKKKVIYGAEFITGHINDRVFRISSRSFYQINSEQTVNLYNKALELAELTGKETVLDLYCGVGTIGILAADRAAKVIGGEIVEEAVENARANAVLNGLGNMEFICGDAGHIANEILERNQHIDVVIVDPPRKGLDSVTIEALRKIAADRIVYVSCNPSTLARDLKILTEGEYSVKVIQPVDMFPQTYHIETVCLLSR